MKPVLDCTEEEHRFVFHLLTFDLKEFSQETGRVSFELHFTRTFVIRITVTSDKLVFSNEWVHFNEKGRHAIETEPVPALFVMLNVFMNNFAESFLKELGWEPSYIPEWSVFKDSSQALEYIKFFSQTMNRLSAGLKDEDGEAPSSKQTVKAGGRNHGYKNYKS